MNIITVPFYAALLALLFVYLSARVIRIRRQKGIPIGNGNDKQLTRARDVLFNFTEYTPLTLILIAFLELQTSFPSWLIHILCLSLLLGRITHAFGVCQQKENYNIRVYGMYLTFASLVTSTILLIVLSLSHFLQGSLS